MLKGEFAKFTTPFNLILLAILLLLNICVVAYQFRDDFSPDLKEIKTARSELLDIYNENPNHYYQLLENYRIRQREYEAEQYKSLINDEKTKVIFENKLIDFDNYGDSNLFYDVNAIINLPETYQKTIRALLIDTSARLQEINADDNYLWQYYLSLINVYDSLSELSLPVTEVKGWSEFFALETPIIFIVFTLLSLYCQVFTIDKKAGMNTLIHISRNGEKRITLTKLVFVLISSTVITIIFTLSPLCIIIASHGLSNIQVPIQAISSFTYCPYEISIGQYLILFVLTKVLIFVCLSLAIAFINKIFDYDAPAFIFVIMVAALSVYMSRVPTSSKYFWIKKFSPLELAKTNILYDRFRGLHIFNGFSNYTYTVLILIILVITILFVMIYFHHSQYIVKTKNKSEIIFTDHKSMSLLSLEFYKQFIAESGIYILIAAIILKCILSVIYFKPSISSTEAVYMEYMSNLSGEITDEKLQYIEDEQKYINEVISKHSGVVSAYQNGELSGEEYSKHMSQYNYAKYCEYACERLCERRDYLLSVKNSFDNVNFIYEKGIMMYIESPVDVIAFLLAIFLFCKIFAMEYDCGFYRILRVSKYGRRKIFIIKLITAAIISTIVYSVFTLIDVIFLNIFYDTSYIHAGIISIPNVTKVEINISIMNYVILSKLIGYVGYMISSFIIIAISVLLSKQISAIIISGILLFIPTAAVYYGIEFMRIFSLTEFCSSSDIFLSIPSGIICTISAIVLVVLASRKWIGKSFKT